MAIQMLLRSKYSGCIAGVAALSCFLSASSPVWDSIASIPRTAPLMMMHGEQDSMVPPQWGQSTASRLKQCGLNVVFSTVPNLGHDLDMGELRDVLKWLFQLHDNSGLKS